MKLSYRFSEAADTLIVPEIFREIVREIERSEKKKFGEICFIFVSPGEILDLNRRYLRHDYLTDVMCFERTGKKLIAGDIFVCPEVVRKNARKLRENAEREMLRVMIHGILHLVGYEDNTDYLKEEMHKRENRYLDRQY